MRSHWLRMAAACCAIALGLAACGSDASGNSSGGGTAISIWEGWTGAEAKTFAHLVSVYQKQNPGTTVSSLYVNNDDTLQKVLTAVRGGSPPDIAYLYGSWAPNVAQIPQVVNLTKVVQRPGRELERLLGRRARCGDGQRQGHRHPCAGGQPRRGLQQDAVRPGGPEAAGAGNWTWQQFVADAAKLTNPAKKQFGTAYVTPGTEDTVWHWEALLWEAGGSILAPGNKKAAFDSPAGLQSLNTLRTMAVSNHSMYLDPTDSAYANLFNSGRIGMLVTGPWDLSAFPNVHYGVQIMPSFPGTSGGHQTISGPGQLGDLQQRRHPDRGGGEVPALAHRPGPGEVLVAGHRGSADPAVGGTTPGFLQQMNKALPGVDTFVTNLGNVHQARPQTPVYPKVSQVLGNMIVSVLLGKSQPSGRAGQRRPAGQPGPGQPERLT